MKYLSLLFFVLTLFIFGSCVSKDGEDYLSDVGRITKFEYEGHTYLIRGSYQKGGICHDENCKCKKTENKENLEL